VLAALDWASLTAAGAFVAGAIVGSVATTRLMRALLDYLRAEQRDARKRQ
jgi:hypothetical protein